MTIQKPAVKKQTLLLISGMLWTAVGILLNLLAFRWLMLFSRSEEIILIMIGIFAAILISLFGFSKLAAKNIKRIMVYPTEVCVFAFQEWRSYIIIIIMMGMGIFLRSSSFFPKSVLTPMYVGIGTALFLSSFKYYSSYFKLSDNN